MNFTFTLDKEEDIQILNDYFSKYKNLGIYQRCMFCPECKQAELSYIPKTSQEHLKRRPVLTHTNWCSPIEF